MSISDWLNKFGFATPAQLKEAGIMGMNERNISLINGLNDRLLFPLVDDKLLTKRAALEHKISVPELITSISTQRDVSPLLHQLEGEEDFVTKPAKGSGGRGILVIDRLDQEFVYLSNQTTLQRNEFAQYLSNVLGGLFSLGGQPDTVMVERKVKFDKVLSRFSYQGIPDLRVIVYRGFPVLAMARLATKRSKGKANLHQGAIGVGIDLLSGKALSGVGKNKTIDTHPDTGLKIADLEVPYWMDILSLATSCYEVTGLGYLGADIVIDAEKGPTLLELNARPGLAIQVANMIGLEHRTKIVEEIYKQNPDAGKTPVTERVQKMLEKLQQSVIAE